MSKNRGSGSVRIAIIVFTMMSAVGLQFLFSCQSNYSIETIQHVTNGSKVYMAHCQNCHGAKGEGLGTLYPPLTDAEFLADNREILPCIVRHGTHKDMQVSGKHFRGSMPGIPEMPEIDIAYVLSYVTVQFGNDKEAFKVDEVREYLKNCKKNKK